jgi:hypothetical protein
MEVSSQLAVDATLFLPEPPVTDCTDLYKAQICTSLVRVLIFLQPKNVRVPVEDEIFL